MPNTLMKDLFTTGSALNAEIDNLMKQHPGMLSCLSRFAIAEIIEQRLTDKRPLNILVQERLDRNAAAGLKLQLEHTAEMMC